MPDDAPEARTRRAADVVGLSRHLSYVLRHQPASVGIELDPGGWVAVADLLPALAEHGRDVSLADLREVRRRSDKDRFELRDGRIRARYGHSVAVDLDLVPAAPPAVLLHGTVARFLDAIRAEGLRPGARQHVHLSADMATARQVGGRRGAPVVLTVEAGAMAEAGHRFWHAADGVWLTAHVPPAYLGFPGDQEPSG